MHASWSSYSNSSPFASVWFAILSAGSLGIITWAAPGIMQDIGKVPGAIAIPQVLFLFGVVPIGVSASPLLRWIWDSRWSGV